MESVSAYVDPGKSLAGEVEEGTGELDQARLDPRSQRRRGTSPPSGLQILHRERKFGKKKEENI